MYTAVMSKMPIVRTTLTLDDDLAARLRDDAHERGISFKAAANEAIRSGLEQSRRPRPYRLRARRMGVPAVDLTKATQLAAQLEDEELARRLRGDGEAADTNVLLAAVNRDARGHQTAAEWLATNLSGSEPTGFAWLALVGFVRIVTKASIFAHPLTESEALDFVDEWLACPNATVLHPGERHSAVLRSLLAAAGTAGNLVSDAHLAALAIERGAKLATLTRTSTASASCGSKFLRA